MDFKIKKRYWGYWKHNTEELLKEIAGISVLQFQDIIQRPKKARRADEIAILCDILGLLAEKIGKIAMKKILKIFSADSQEKEDIQNPIPDSEKIPIFCNLILVNQAKLEWYKSYYEIFHCMKEHLIVKNKSQEDYDLLQDSIKDIHQYLIFLNDRYKKTKTHFPVFYCID